MGMAEQRRSVVIDMVERLADTASRDLPVEDYSDRNGRTTDYRERLVRIETRLETVATREDIANLGKTIAEKDSERSKWLIGVVVTVVLGLIAACATVIVSMIKF